MAKIITVPNNPLPKIQTINGTMAVSLPAGVQDPSISLFNLTLKGNDYTVWKTNTYDEELVINNAKYAEGDAIQVVGQVVGQVVEQDSVKPILAPTINYSYNSLKSTEERKILPLRPTALTQSYGISVSTVKDVFGIVKDDDLPALLPIHITNNDEALDDADYYAYLTADEEYYLIPIAIFFGEELWEKSLSQRPDSLETEYTYYKLNSGTTDYVALGEYDGYSFSHDTFSRPYLYESTYSMSITYNNQTHNLTGFAPFTDNVDPSNGVFILIGFSSSDV